MFLAVTKQLYEWFCLAVCVYLSVSLFVCLSITPFSQCSCHGIIMKFSGVITFERSDLNCAFLDCNAQMAMKWCIKAQFGGYFGSLEVQFSFHLGPQIGKIQVFDYFFKKFPLDSHWTRILSWLELLLEVCRIRATESQLSGPQNRSKFYSSVIFSKSFPSVLFDMLTGVTIRGALNMGLRGLILCQFGSVNRY